MNQDLLASVTDIFELVTDNIPSGVLIVDADDVVRYANPSLGQLCGVDAEELAGHTLDHPALAPVETCMRPHRGTLKRDLLFVRFSAVPVPKPENGGEPDFYTGWLLPLVKDDAYAGTVVTIRDVSDAARAEQALSNSEMRHRTLVEHLAEGIWLLNPLGTTTFANPAMAAFLGVHQDDLAGRSILDFLTPVGRDEMRLALEGWASGQCTRMATTMQRADGTVFDADLALSCLATDQGDSAPDYGCSGFLATVRDVTRRVRAEEELHAANLQLEQRVDERTRELKSTIRKYRREIIIRKWAEDELKRSQERYTAIVEDQVEMVCRFKPEDYTLTFVNESYCRTFGAQREEVIGTSFLPLIPEQDHEICTLWISAISPATPEAATLHRAVDHAGSVRWLEWINRGVFDKSGKLVEVQAVGRDVTDRVEAEEKARQAAIEATKYRQNLEAIFHSIPDAILTVDNDMRILNSNEAIDKLCCEAREMTAGKSLLDISGGQIRPCMKVLIKTLKTRKPVSEYRVECSAGVSPNQVMLLSSAPLLDHHGEHAGAVLLIRDITRLAELERRLDERSQFQNMIGKSPKMQQVFTILEQLVDLDTTVLITGESGTGKELIVDALHYFGARDTGPLIKVNCSALPETLLESELFGHAQGAFTGAVRDKVGRFQAAEGGTIFLDEIGDISPAVQLKLLRVLEQKEYERVGDSRTYKADVRVIAATNVDLRQRVKEKKFRDDLFYRLQVMDIHLPPLRERDGDVPLFTEHFIHQFRPILNKDIVGVDDEVMNIFLTYPWPGNVRELKHTLERACILCPGGRITPAHLPQEILTSVGAPNGAATPRDAERDALLHVLENARWNKSRAAAALGISRPTLYRRMQRLGIDQRAVAGEPA